MFPNGIVHFNNQDLFEAYVQHSRLLGAIKALLILRSGTVTAEALLETCEQGLLKAEDALKNNTRSTELERAEQQQRLRTDPEEVLWKKF
jgi:hypothetical protein